MHEGVTTVSDGDDDGWGEQEDRGRNGDARGYEEAETTVTG